MSKKERLCPYGPTNTYIINSPIGQLKLTSCLKGIHSLGMLGEITDENFKPDAKVSVSLISQLYQDNGYMYNPAIEAISWLEAFFKDEAQKTENHPKICKYVGKNDPVGQAMRNNPVMLIIPCHRVINENGTLGNYHYGTRNRVKEWLLHHEHAIKK